MEWLKNVLKVEDTSLEPHNIRGIFSKCGEIPALYPFDAVKLGDAHYFIEFANPESAEKALGMQLDIPGISVLPVYSTPHLIEQYRDANPDAFDPSLKTGKSSNHHSDKFSSTGLKMARKNGQKGASSLSRKKTSGAAERSHSEHTAISNPSGPKNTTNRKTTNTLPNSAPHVPPTAPAALRNALATLDECPQICVTSMDSVPPKSTAAFTFDTPITMMLCGEALVYDLKYLEPDASGIIELLKVTRSERGAWMVVAASYRRRGNLVEAIRVIEALIEVMITMQVPEEQLRPAFLMLSGCETDWAVQVKAEGADVLTVAEHYLNAQKWLQKVYSATRPSRFSQPMPKFTSTSQQSEAPIMSSSIKVKPAPTNPHDRIMQREMQSLRDRNAAQAAELLEIRSLKRKLEDEVGQERELRNKMQRQLETAEKERDLSRRLETYALGQVKREVALRRLAEERAEKERQTRMDVQYIAEKRATKPLFEDLANMMYSGAHENMAYGETRESVYW
ncbi:hypothetical protein BDQ12DRAFT_717975 [Crucibulum laeve]|uniref:RRM domain-containing protein n=1 Tax=Crucibulum laeve TaxID=68775 RepID=A0A5C3MKC2_9AGAR|nr:hypothetical protein BDQ12DRAFT_717975 [Crucibulum laeve]